MMQAVITPSRRSSARVEPFDSPSLSSQEMTLRVMRSRRSAAWTPQHAAHITSGACRRPGVRRWGSKGSALALGQGQDGGGQSLTCQFYPALGLEAIDRSRVCACLSQTINETLTLSVSPYPPSTHTLIHRLSIGCQCCLLLLLLFPSSNFYKICLFSKIWSIKC